MIMRKFFLIILFLAASTLATPDTLLAMMHGQGRHMGPYGGYCRGPKWGWYGAGRQVKTEEEVRELVEEFLRSTDLSPGKISDLETFFTVEVTDSSGQVMDLLIIDKRNCRIRSAY